MAITQAGNFTFAGNYLAGDGWEPNDLLSCLRTAVGSTRAEINRTNASHFRIDWRPDIVSETLTGTVGVPPAPNILPATNTLAANSRMGFSQYNVNNSGSQKSGILLEAGSLNPSGFNQMSPTFSGSAKYWACATTSSISYFVLESGTYWFLSEGVLVESVLSYPVNRYGIWISSSPGEAIANSANSGIVQLFTSTAIANYAHTRNSDGASTNSEVEFVLRRKSDNNQLGYVPGVFKVKINGSESSIAIGNIIKLDMSANTKSLYTGLGTIFCVVVSRLGNSSETDLSGDYLAMYIAG